MIVTEVLIGLVFVGFIFVPAVVASYQIKRNRE